MHTEGEPLRIIIGGLPEIKGNTILTKQKYFKEHLDFIRKRIINEPRGHADMYAAIMTEGCSPGSDFGVFFLHNAGYSSMCGHAVIALAKFVCETGWAKNLEDIDIRIDVPAGTVVARVNKKYGEILSTSFENVPSFVYLQSHQVELENLETIPFDIAYGGAFYAIVDADKLGVTITPNSYFRLIDLGRKIKKAVNQSIKIVHPFEEGLGFLYGTIFTGKPHNPLNHSRNVCIFADGEVDRSPTGSGVSARAALHFAGGDMLKQKAYTIESIIDSTMHVKIKDQIQYGPYNAVIPEVTGTSFFTGYHEFWFDQDDPLKNGFFLR